MLWNYYIRNNDNFEKSKDMNIQKIYIKFQKKNKNWVKNLIQ